MPITYDEVSKARQGAESATQSATQFASSGANVESELKDALRSKLAANKPLIEGRNEAQAAYLAAPANARATYADPESEQFIFNPYQRQKLITNEQSLAYQPYANLTDYIGLSLGSINDIARQGAANYQTEAASRMAAADLANQQYQNLFNEYLQTQELDLARQKQSADQNPTGLEALLSYLVGGGQQQQQNIDYGEEPLYSPMQNGERVVNDLGIVWEFQDSEWVPVGSV